MRLNISQEAWVDIIETAVYIAKDKPSVADDVFEKFEYTCELLLSMPEIGAPIDDLLDTSELGEEIREILHARPLLEGVRRFPVKRFRKLFVFYKVENDALNVLRVISARRDLPTIFAALELEGQ